MDPTQIGVIFVSIILAIIVMSSFMYYNHNRVYHNYINGFWCNSEQEENSIIIYMNNNDHIANIVVGRDGNVLSDNNYTYVVTDVPSDDVVNIIQGGEIKKCKIKFIIDDGSDDNEDSEDVPEDDEYSSIFTDSVFMAEISLHLGLMSLVSDGEEGPSITLYKDNIMTNQLVNYVAE